MACDAPIPRFQEHGGGGREKHLSQRARFVGAGRGDEHRCHCRGRRGKKLTTKGSTVEPRG